MTLKQKTPMQRKAPIKVSKPAPGPRLKRCAVCRERFQPRSMTHKACKPECAAIHAVSIRKAQERKSDRERRTALKTRQDWFKEAQTAINKWVREVRDAGLPCISCGRHHQGQIHAGHYLSRGAHPNLALVENNLASQCAPCNTYLSGNQVHFRIGLVKRIGLAAVEALESDATPRKYTIQQLQEIKAEYSKRLKDAKKSL